jgi:PhoH-like ATPase
MGIKSRVGKKLFVLDTNVLMHDPDLDLPLCRARHLPPDGGAGRTRPRQEGYVGSRAQRPPGQPLPRRPDVARHPRPDIDSAGYLPLTGRNIETPEDRGDDWSPVLPDTASGRSALPANLPGNIPDNNILGTALALKEMAPDPQVILVSKDINLRIKAAVIGINAEDYHNDQVLDDVDLLYTGNWNWVRISGKHTARTWILAGRGPHLLPRVRTRYEGLVQQPVPVHGGRASLRGHRAREADGEDGDHRLDNDYRASKHSSGASMHATASRTSR